jgi:hypothetical protein
LSAGLFVAGMFAHIAGVGDIRQAGGALGIGLLSGMISMLFCFWPLQGLFVAPTDSKEPVGDVVAAEISGDESE